MLYKSTGALRLKDLDTKQGIIQAYWSAFGNEDDGGDIVLPGAFTKSINEWGPRGLQPRIKYLWQHDSGQILGKPSELLQDDTGLLATAQIVKTSLGLDVLLLYEAGVITEHSIGYETVLATFDKLKRARLLQELKLYEGSAVTWGMNSQTPTVAVKSLMDAVALADRRGRLHKLLHDAPLRTASVAARLEDELRAIEALLARLDPPKARPAVILGGRSALDALATQLAGGDPAEGKAADMPKDIPMPDGKPAKRERTPPRRGDFLTVYNTDREPWDLIEDLDGYVGGAARGHHRRARGGLRERMATTRSSKRASQFAAKVMEWVAMAEVQSCWAEIADSAEEAQGNATDAGVERLPLLGLHGPRARPRGGQGPCAARARPGGRARRAGRGQEGRRPLRDQPRHSHEGGGRARGRHGGHEGAPQVYQGPAREDRAIGRRRRHGQ
jgi:HK97 family phage prohead protease